MSRQIEKDFLAAYKAKEKEKVAVLRMLKTAMKNKQVELGKELSDEDILGLIAKEVKQRQESITQFNQAGRKDLAEKEETESAILKEYLPSQFSQQETQEKVDEIIHELGARSMQDMGKVMQAVMEKYKGRVDGKVVNELVRSRLSG